MLHDILALIFDPETKDGHVQALRHNPAVPIETLTEILQWKKAGTDDKDVIERLRLRTVPSGYTPCLWSGKCVPLFRDNFLCKRLYLHSRCKFFVFRRSERDSD